MEQENAVRAGTVINIPLTELYPFPNHPFKVREDNSMMEMVESVKNRGVLSPVLVRPRPDGGYEMVSGHRRKMAAELAELATVRKLTEHIQTGDEQTIQYSEADFARINGILEKNKLEYISTPQKTEVGNVLLAGATGYLGIHILADFIEHENGVAFCLVRGKNQADSERRLADLLDFYFGERYSECDRIKVLCADLQKDHLGLTEQEYEAIIPEITTVINAAASVKHYGSYQYFYEANVGTVKRLVDFCRDAKAKLIHTSTISVSGNSFADEFTGYISETEKHFYESSLYIGQPLNNVYARSKFEAEKVVLEAMTEGLEANSLDKIVLSRWCNVQTVRYMNSFISIVCDKCLG